MEFRLDGADCVRRALVASEIAESCPEPNIRESFLALTADWLRLATDAEHPVDETQDADARTNP